MLQDSVVEEIAAEDESSRVERQRLEQKVAALRKLLDRLRRLHRHHLTGSRVQRDLYELEADCASRCAKRSRAASHETAY